VFDANAPVDTSEWMNVIDTTEPASTVLPLAAVQGSSSFVVQWSGMDVGSGVKDYTVFVSDNGAPFVPFTSRNAGTSATFNGQVGHRYEFFSTARDQAGNVERKSPIAEAATQVVVADATPPTTVATPSVSAGSVAVALVAQDAPVGSGVQQVTYSLSGAQTGGAVVPGSSASVVISAVGTTTLTYFAVDMAGNQELPKTLAVQVGTATNTTCTGSMTGILKNVDVPDGASCVLSGAIVEGNVHVKRGASLSVGPLGVTTIRGNVEADHCLSVWLAGTVTVEGNLHIQHCTLDSGYEGPGVEVGGNVQCQNNSGACQAVSGWVGGNLQVKSNISDSASDISGNTIGGNLQCQGNMPAPTHTAPNDVHGNKQGECKASLGF
jgi:hypothetical protein